MASPLGQYYVRVKDHTGTQVAIFDNWYKLSYSNVVNGVGDYQLVLDGNDTRVSLFGLDYQIEVWRKVPGLSDDWRIDFEGFHRKQERSTDKDGRKTFISSGLSYNDLLARTVIGYKEGTIRAEKNAPAETVMKEYVRENCTDLGDATVVGRLNFDEHIHEYLIDGVWTYVGDFVYKVGLPGFSVEMDRLGGPIWQGERAYENLLTTLQDIASTTGIDFNVVGVGSARFEFRTYLNGVGTDRRQFEIISQTGLNEAGNQPVLFSVPFGTIEQIAYSMDALAESNAVMVLGENELSLREVYTQADTEAIALSPWNRREVTRPGSNQDNIDQYRQFGNEVLEELKRKEMMEFDPMQTASHCYGIHYFAGDLVTAVYDEIELHRKLTKITVTISGDNEQIEIEFSDIKQR